MTSAHRQLLLTAATLPWMDARALGGLTVAMRSPGDARSIRRIVVR